MELVANSGSINLRNANVCNLPSTPVYTLSDEEKKAGFEILFDGRSLDNWQGNTTGYTPDNGTIFVTANYGGSGNLYTKKKYSDFVYRFDFRYETPGVNNGVGIRTNIGSDAAYDGMEIQILDHDDPIYAGLQPYQMHGSVYGICVPKHITFKAEHLVHRGNSCRWRPYYRYRERRSYYRLQYSRGLQGTQRSSRRRRKTILIPWTTKTTPDFSTRMAMLASAVMVQVCVSATSVFLI